MSIKNDCVNFQSVPYLLFLKSESKIKSVVQVAYWQFTWMWRQSLFKEKNAQNVKKLALYGTDGRLLRNLRPFKVRSHVTQKLGQISKIWSVQNLDIVP